MKRALALAALTIFSSAFSGCLDETNAHLTGVEQSTKSLADEVKQDHQYLETGTAVAQQAGADMTKATNALERAVAKGDDLTARVDTMNAHLASLSDSLSSLNKNVAEVPAAVDRVGLTVQDVSKNAAALEEQTKRLADNMGVMVAYTAVALKFAQDFATKQQALGPTVPALPETPGAKQPAEQPSTLVPSKDAPPDTSVFTTGKLTTVPIPH